MAYRRFARVDRTIACTVDGHTSQNVLFLSATSVKLGEDVYQVEDLNKMLQDHQNEFGPKEAPRNGQVLGVRTDS